MNSTVTFDETASIPLSADQWQGLARLGELVTVVDRALDGPMGAVSVGYLASLMTLAPSNTLSAVREVLEMLTEWHEHGVLTQIRALVDMMGSVLSSENINTVAMATLHKARESHVPAALRALSRELSDVAQADTAGLGGLGGLMRLMMDKDVQAGLRVMGMTAGKIRSVMHSDPQGDRDSARLQH